MENLKVFKLEDDAVLPTRAHGYDAAVDIYALEDTFLELTSTTKVKTGVAISVPEGYVGKIEDRSSMAAKGLRTGGGVIDAGYNGEVGIIMHNLTNGDEITWRQNGHTFGYTIKKGDKIAQLLVYKVETPDVVEVNELWSSERGSKSFGSSGR